MTSATPAPIIPFPTSVELFYSYAHADGPLCEELRKHLTGLKRSGLIRDWYDRKIDEGSEWAQQIQDAMERAGIILLLISSDFLASSYINDKELPFALKRHTDGAAVVIPVLLRPVEWHDTPFAKLQVLPTDAKPVTAWPDHDSAFSDVAGRLRELLYRRRVNEASQPVLPTPTAVPCAERVLDAAIASAVAIEEPTDLVLMVRTKDSGGLQAILRIDRSYSPQAEDVHSKTITVDFPHDPAGAALPATLGLALQSPGCDPPAQTRKIRIPPAGDSDIVVFMLTPKRAGILKLSLQLLDGDVEIGSQRLVTNALMAVGESLSYGVVTMPLSTSGAVQAATPFAAPVAAAQLVTAIRAPEPEPNKLPRWMVLSSSIAAALICAIFLIPGLHQTAGTATFSSKTPAIAVPAAPDTEQILKAYTEYRTALNNKALPSPDTIRQQLNEAELLDKTDHKEEARKAWQELLKATPDDAANPVRSFAEHRLATIP